MVSNIEEGKKPIKVVRSQNQQPYISNRDAEMDARAVKAVQVAIEKARFCGKPVAGYDIESKKAYMEYPNGERKYVN